MILKYTLRLIKSTFNRFIAILAIVFIGVSFMMGLRSNYNIMCNSVEQYLDDKNLYDVQIYSNYGFDDDDVKNINELDCVEKVFVSKTRDVYSKDKAGNELVSRIIELNSDMNGIELQEGRMPEKENECLIVGGYSSSELAINDKISLYFKDDEISQTLENSEFTIVGLGKSSEHMSLTFNTSLLNNKTLSNVIYIPNSNFISDYYTCMYIQLKDGKQMDSFSKEYSNFVDEKVNIIESYASEHSSDLKTKIIEQATLKLEEGKKELADEKEKYQKEFDDAKKQLDDAKILLDNSLLEIKSGEAKIAASEIELKNGQAQIDAGYVEIKAQEEKLNEAKTQLESYGMSLDQLRTTVDSAYSLYNTTKQNISRLEEEINNLSTNRSRYEEIINNSPYRGMSKDEVSDLLDECDPQSEEYQELLKVYEAMDSLESLDRRIKAANFTISSLNFTLTQVENTIKSQFDVGSIDEACSMIINGIDQIKDGEAQIQDGYAKLEKAKVELENGKIELENGKIELENGRIAYANGLKEYEDGLKEYEDGLKEFNLKMRDAQDQIDDGEEQIKDLQESGWHILKRYNTNYSFYMYKNTCEQMKSIGDIIPLLFFVVAALVCSTTMTRLIDEQRGQIGIYSALGFRRGEITSIYLLYVILASLIASVLAIGFGVIVFPNIIYTTWRLMYVLPDIILSVPLSNAVLCILCFTVLMVAVTLIVISKSLKECSAQLLRPKAPKGTKQIFLEKWTWLWSKLPFTSKVTARNILRYKGRFIMTVIGVAGCTSLLVLGFGIKDSISSVVSLQFGEIEKYSYVVDIKNDRHIDEIIDVIKNDKNNQKYVEFSQYTSPITIGDKDLTLTINIVDKDRINDIFGISDHYSGKVLPLTDNGVLVSQKFCDVNDIHIGDTLKLKSLNGTEGEVIVEGIVTNYVGDVVYISENNYKKSFNENIEYTTIGIINNGDSSKLVELQNQFQDINTINDLSSRAATFDDMMKALNLIIIVIIVVAGALAFVVLINLTNVNISERIREIATLKVLGFRENEVNSYIFKEVLLMSIVGDIIGLPLGNIETKFVIGIIDMEMCSFPQIIFPLSYAYAFVITIIFTGIVLLLTRKTLRKVEMVESLKSIE